jgi:hypothetical protein
MGVGDNVMASGMARGASARGKRIAFGDGKRIIWDKNSEIVFRGNPNIATVGSEAAKDLEWIEYYQGNRIYTKQASDRWIWNYDFRAVPGELFLDQDEQRFSSNLNPGFVVIEPNVPVFKAVRHNKQWPVHRFLEVAKRLQSAGYQIVQLLYPKSQNRIPGAIKVFTQNYRLAVATLKRAGLYIGPEGGLHHASAAVGTRAVVLFGGFVPPQVTGYETHTNLTGGAEACGSINPCSHCRAAMEAISVDEVEAEALKILGPCSAF